MTGVHSAGRDRTTHITLAPRPARSVASPPRPLNRLIGRQDDIARAIKRLERDETRLLTLTGPGGIGKTRLALGIIDALPAGLFDAVAWISLVPVRDVDEVMPAIARAIGVADSHPGSSLDSIRTALRHQRTLLVIDNCEHVLDFVVDLPALLTTCPGLTVLATSREPLCISGEWLQQVSPLPLPAANAAFHDSEVARAEALQLFVARAEAVDASFMLDATTWPAAVRICRELEGIPLAIQLAASHLDHLSLDDLDIRVRQSLTSLESGQRDDHERHRTMRNAIAWSYELLLPEEQRLLRTLATFNGGFTMAAAEAVYAEPCQAMVAALVRKSLIRKMPGSSTPSRYVMLETIREFAADLPVPETEAAQTRKRFIAWFLDLAAAATSVAADQRNAAPLDEIEAEHGNFLVTLQWLEEEARWEEGLRLAADLALNWDVRGHLGDSRAWLERSLQPVRTAGMPPSLRAEAEARLAVILLRLNEIELAERYLHSARRYHETDGRRLSLAFVYLVLGGAAEARHDDVEGKHFFREALRLYRLEENPAGISQSLTNLAEIAYRRRDYTTAQTLMQESMVHARASGRTVPVSYALAVNALIAHATGDDAAAMDFLREAITFSRDNQYEGGIGDALVIMALITANRGQAVIAARLLGAAEAVIERLGLPRLTHWPQHRDAITRTQELLDPARYETLFCEGQHLTPEDAIREALETEPPSMGQDIARFTPRELDVLRLLVAGKTNRAIADDLFLGTRTVESHVARILGKLGVNTRAAAVMAAVEHGLVPRTPATP